ncbi:hypothetical protein [Flavobacterium sp.]|uniref:hypothetical protein n=1 Tax=Flavobacterium sp. TaxID=239 RepID=UPI0026217374|nr:hypothetical protein [Flavobacterium sp.]
MKIDRVALNVYLILCVVAIFANFYELYGLKLVSKSLLIPVLFFYYLGNVSRVDVIACFYFLFNFIGDSIGVFELEDEVIYLIIPFFFCNISLIFIMLKKLERPKMSFINVLAILIISIFLSYLWWSIVDVFSYREDDLQYEVGIYGASLFLISFLASYIIINRMNLANLFLLFCVLCILMSDVFYVVYNFQAKIAIFDTIHFSTQIFSYLLFVKYMINREVVSNV